MLTETEGARRADELVRGAHARAYRYPPGFEGFCAELAWRTEQGSGGTTVVARTGPEVELDGGSGDEPEWVVGELRSIVGHRQHSEYEHGDGSHDGKRLTSSTHMLGELVELGDSLDSSYRVAGGEISTVTRTMGNRRFTIVVHERSPMPDGRTLPTSFTVFFWDEESGALTATEAYRDEVVEVDGVFLPARRRVVRGDEDGLTVRELELSEHATLGVAVTR
jgi:hypothetical protein